MPLTKEQTKFVETVATEGTVSVAMESLDIGYDTLMIWNDDPEFTSRTAQAKKFALAQFNEEIVMRGKKCLLDRLIKGVIELHTTVQTIRNADGEVTGDIATTKRVYKGVDIAAIKLALELMPMVDKAIAVLIAENGIPNANLEQLQENSANYQAGLRSSLFGENQQVIPEDYVIAQIQKSLTGG